jgi:hypothetical protein
MSLLAVKLVVTPLILLAASLASSRFGDAVGDGWSGCRSPQGRLLAAQAAFYLGYAALARRGVPAALAAGAFAYLTAGGRPAPCGGSDTAPRARKGDPRAAEPADGAYSSSSGPQPSGPQRCGGPQPG